VTFTNGKHPHRKVGEQADGPGNCRKRWVSPGSVLNRRKNRKKSRGGSGSCVANEGKGRERPNFSGTKKTGTFLSAKQGVGSTKTRLNRKEEPREDGETSTEAEMLEAYKR